MILNQAWLPLSPWGLDTFDIYNLIYFFLLLVDTSCLPRKIVIPLMSLTVEPRRGYALYRGRHEVSDKSTKSAGLEPAKWLDQNELPYHLATTYYIIPEEFYGRKHQSYLDSPLTPTGWHEVSICDSINRTTQYILLPTYVDAFVHTKGITILLTNLVIITFQDYTLRILDKYINFILSS